MSPKPIVKSYESCELSVSIERFDMRLTDEVGGISTPAEELRMYKYEFSS